MLPIVGSVPSVEIAQLFEQPDHKVDLGQAACAIARLEYPTLDFALCLDRIDDFAAAAGSILGSRSEPDAAVSAINRVMFEELGFRGNHDDYYDARNSCLNDVLERRTGIPITLSVVYLEIARRLGLPIYGVGLPSHFLVKYDDGSRLFFVDPFHEGRSLTRQGCRDLLKQLHGRPVELTDLHFAAVENRQIVLRMCENLRSIYLTNCEYHKALETVEIILALEPASAEDLKQRAWIKHELGRRNAALEDLEAYSAIRPDGQDSADVEAWMTNIRRTMAQLN